MTVENTGFSNIKLVVDEFNIPVAVQIDGTVKYRLYDNVTVKGDIMGYICPGITVEGQGRIVEIRRDDTDHFFGVLMNNNGQFGFVKEARLSK